MEYDMVESTTIQIANQYQLQKLIDTISERTEAKEYDANKHTLKFIAPQPISIRLPFFVCFDQKTIKTSNFLIILAHAGEAALAYSEEDQIIEHKVVKAYMVRQKQGKSQLKHLKTKGKSKAGSRVRLAETDHFFERINEKITEWTDYFKIHKIAISCNKTIQPFLFNKNKAALKKEDKRLYRIPKHVQEAKFENLIKVHNYLISTEVQYDPRDKKMIEEVIFDLTND